MRASDTAVSKPCYRVSPVRKWANGLHIKKNNNKINKKLHKNWMQMETDEPNVFQMNKLKNSPRDREIIKVTVEHWLYSSVQFSRSVVSDSLWPHESQHARPPCPSPTPRVDSNSCPSSRWCHPASSSSVVPFSSCPQTHPASGSFPMSQLFESGGQSWSFSYSISPSNEYPGLISFRMDWLDLLAVQGTQESSPTPQFKSINSSALSFLHSPTLTSIHDYWKNHSLD